MTETAQALPLSPEEEKKGPRRTILKLKCPSCGKSVTEVRTSMFGKRRLVKLSCGHSTMAEQLQTVEEWEKSSDGRELYEFQKTGVRFIESSNFRCLVADQMGLGKTVQGLIAVKRNIEKLTPLLVVCKAGLRLQWAYEMYRWIGDDFLSITVDNHKTKPYIGNGSPFKAVIVSFDMLRRLEWIENEAVLQKFGAMIIDEVQLIKNPGAARTKALRMMAQHFDHIVGLSGTPIKNNAGEYFPILNILKPGVFPSQKDFVWSHCDTYTTRAGYTKIGGLRNIKAFRELTEGFIIRRTRDEVLPDLPKVSRQFHYSDLATEVEEAYKEAYKQFLEEYDSTGGNISFAPGSNILAYMSMMRHLTGLSKVEPTIDYVEDFIESTDEEQGKIVLFVHHKDVHKMLHLGIKARLGDKCNPPLDITADVMGAERLDLIEEFKNNPLNRVMIASTLSAGEGTNLQFASNMVLVERQWNPSGEEQAESRFTRIGSTADRVNCNYMVAIGTIDEYFAEIIERKRSNVSQTLGDGDNTTPWNETSILTELAQILASKGRAKWKL